jgi:hypothetical protein
VTSVPADGCPLAVWTLPSMTPPPDARTMFNGASAPFERSISLFLISRSPKTDGFHIVAFGRRRSEIKVADLHGHGSEVKAAVRGGHAADPKYAVGRFESDRNV